MVVLFWVVGWVHVVYLLLRLAVIDVLVNRFGLFRFSPLASFLCVVESGGSLGAVGCPSGFPLARGRALLK